MAKLTDTQLIVLSAAAARDDGIAMIPAKMNKAAASKVGSSLVSRKLMRAARSKLGMPIWRVDKDDRPISLVITRAGRNAIGVDEDPATDADAPLTNNKSIATHIFAASQCSSGLPRIRDVQRSQTQRDFTQLRRCQRISFCAWNQPTLRHLLLLGHGRVGCARGAHNLENADVAGPSGKICPSDMAMIAVVTNLSLIHI